MDVSLDSLEQDLLRPISSELPAGPSLRLDESFEELDRLIKATDSLTATATPDWRLIAFKAHHLSSGKSKDILILGYQCLALTHARGIEGLASAMSAMHKVVRAYWQQIHPEIRRLRARGAALDWIMERLLLWVSTREFNQADRSHLKNAMSALTDLQVFCGEELREHAPDIASLIRSIKQHEARLAASEPVTVASVSTPKEPQAARDAAQPISAPAAPKAAEQSPAPAPVKMPTPPSELSDEKAQREYLRQLQLSCRPLVENLLRADPRDPRPYEINRAMTWASIAALPDAKDGKTALRSVPKERLQLFQSLQDQSQHAQLITELEKSFASSPFWLDCHYRVSQSLENLGGTPARRVIEKAVVTFLERYPELASFSFSDGVPFASAETREWLQGLQSGSEASGLGDGRAPVNQQDDDSEEQWQEATRLARAKSMPQAISLLQNHSRQATSESQRFKRQLLLAEFCLQQRHAGMARALLEDLNSRLSNLTLVDWEPELSSRVMQLLLKAGVRDTGPESQDHVRSTYFNRLCLIDAAKALEFQN